MHVMQGPACRAASMCTGATISRDDYGGCYIDWSRGVKLVLLLANADDDARAWYMSRCAEPEWVIIEDVPFNQKNLDEFVNICAELLWDREIRVWLWGPHTRLNGVRLNVEPEQMDNAERILLENALELWREIDPEADFAPTILLEPGGPIVFC